MRRRRSAGFIQIAVTTSDGSGCVCTVFYTSHYKAALQSDFQVPDYVTAACLAVVAADMAACPAVAVVETAVCLVAADMAVCLAVPDST